MLTKLIKLVISQNGEPMTEDEIWQEFRGTYAKSQVALAIQEMLLEGHLYYDVHRKLNLVN